MSAPTDDGVFDKDPIMQIIKTMELFRANVLREQAEQKKLNEELKQDAIEVKKLAIEAKVLSIEAKEIAEDSAKQQHGTNDEYSFAIPWLKTFGIKVPPNYHSQVYKECKSFARGYNPELLRKPFNGFPAMRFDDRTMFFWVSKNRTRTDREKWFMEFKSKLFEERHAQLQNPWPIKVTKSAVEWITDRFRERSVWRLDTLLLIGRSVGLGYEALHSPEVLSLPIRRTVQINSNNKEEWSWRACRNWPT